MTESRCISFARTRPTADFGRIDLKVFSADIESVERFRLISIEQKWSHVDCVPVPFAAARRGAHNSITLWQNRRQKWDILQNGFQAQRKSTSGFSINSNQWIVIETAMKRYIIFDIDERINIWTSFNYIWKLVINQI